MSSSMALWDVATPYFPADYLRPLGTHEPLTCERCGREIPPAENWNRAVVPKRFCSELCRKRAERETWRQRVKDALAVADQFKGALDHVLNAALFAQQEGAGE